MEILDLYTRDRIKTGKTMVRGGKQPEDTYRLVVHICIFNKEGKMLIQQRQPFKSGWSNMWDFSAGGSAITGENSREAAEREVKEELGIDISLADNRPAMTLNFSCGFDDIYLCEKDIDINSLQLQYEEVQDAKWASINEILEMIDEETFIPYHKSLVELLFALRGSSTGAHSRRDNKLRLSGK
ncbi:NUDIX domain-containing protein [Clostridium sp. MSJ-8]|uniref:NUDIX hydrolase n=1 Tax=Clostridium sp. MSJ-8 TaxID=2841510 RepID=UPI001C0EB63A|nr:NUDIX domain-containing protein [Clostridium sp. MSJ-8]MBU5488159.1 NUDIX domain-containing protein [Clostridium sp. MSJ-8]